MFKSDLFTILTIWAFRVLNTQFRKLKSDVQKVPKLAETKKDGGINQQKFNFNQFRHREFRCSPKRYESIKVDSRIWQNVPSGTHCSTSSDTHQDVLLTMMWKGVGLHALNDWKIELFCIIDIRIENFTAHPHLYKQPSIVLQR